MPNETLIHVIMGCGEDLLDHGAQRLSACGIAGFAARLRSAPWRRVVDA
jgi:hypothetical protein